MASTTIWPTLLHAVLVLPVTPRSSPISTIVPLYCSDSEYLVDKDQREEIDPSTDDEHLLDKLYEGSFQGEIDLDDIMVCATHAGRSKGIDAEHLSKTWRNDLEIAERTLDITSQHSMRKDNPTFSRNHGTNGRMLREKRINEYFFMDIFSATKKAGKSSRETYVDIYSLQTKVTYILCP